MMMKILYDYQIFETQRVGGISRYFLELFIQLKRLKNTVVEFPLIKSENIYIKEVGFLKNVKLPLVLFKDFCNGFSFPGKGKLYRFFHLRENKKEIVKRLQNGNFDIFHPTYYNPYFLRYLRDKPFILTVYDMTHEIYSKEMSFFDFSAKYKKKLLLKADKIIAISQNTKKDLIRLYNISPEKINVIYLANSLKPPVDKRLQTLNLPEKYILFVGGRKGYKNFNIFVESISTLIKKDPKLFLVCAGQLFSKEEESLFKNLNIENQVKQYSIDDSTLAHMYQKAICFVFPSRYEGFGIPTLEAFSCGCPVILSNTSCMPEIGGKAAVYIDPLNKKDIEKKVGEVIENSILRKKMISKGYKQLKKFSWEKCAKETQEVYAEVIKMKKPL